MDNSISEYLKKALDKYELDNLDADLVLKKILECGNEIGWFMDEFDWSLDLDS